MSENLSDPFGTLQISKDLFEAQNKFLPTGALFGHISEAARIVATAQAQYGQALMRANAMLVGAFLQPSSTAERDVRPSVVAKSSIPA